MCDMDGGGDVYTRTPFFLLFLSLSLHLQYMLVFVPRAGVDTDDWVRLIEKVGYVTKKRTNERNWQLTLFFALRDSV